MAPGHHLIACGGFAMNLNLWNLQYHTVIMINLALDKDRLIDMTKYFTDFDLISVQR